MEEENKKADLTQETLQEQVFPQKGSPAEGENPPDEESAVVSDIQTQSLSYSEDIIIEEDLQKQNAEDEISAAQEVKHSNSTDFEPVTPCAENPKENKRADLDLVTVSPVEFVSFDEDKEKFSSDPKANLDIMQDVKMRVTVELGRAKSSVKKILDLSKGSIVELNKVAGEQVELYVNGKFVAWGEVIVIEDKFGLRVTNVSSQNLHNL